MTGWEGEAPGHPQKTSGYTDDLPPLFFSFPIGGP